jgi:ligand-binding sensor domain-containing protein
VVNYALSGFDGPVGSIAFDSAGNLWVSTSGGALEFASSQLTTSGTVTAHVTISLSNVTGLAIDAFGDLWVTRSLNGATDELDMFTREQLSSSGSPTPSVTISGSSSGLAGPTSVAV